MKKIGTLLKETRESQGLTIEQVAQKTKIHAHKLSAIENSDYKALPAKVFVKGLIRSYARELKLDEKMIQDICDQEFDEKEVAPQITHTVTHPPIIEEEDADRKLVGRFQAPSSFFLIAGIFVTVILLGFIYVTVSKIQSYTKEESVNLSVDIPESSTEAITPLATDESLPMETKVESEVIPPKETSEKKADEKPKEKPAEKVKVEKEATEKVEQVKTKVEEKAPEVVAVANDEKEAPAKEVTTTVYSDNKLVIEAIEAIRVEILWSDGQTQVLLMKEKEVKTLIFSNPLKIRVNNGGAVNITFNNKVVGVPGTLNKPIELQYP